HWMCLSRRWRAHAEIRKDWCMTTRAWRRTLIAALGIAAVVAASSERPGAQQGGEHGMRVWHTDIGGVVTSVNGPEAGVWVIAETTELPTKFVKIVVTDEQGRYLIPELPKVNYSVWVRGYGLIDSQRVQSPPGKIVNLTALVAPNAAAAAEYYP